MEKCSDTFKNSVVFERLRFENLSVLQKLRLIPGDLTLPNLGLSNESHQLLIENVNFVTNSAAIVKFMAPLAGLSEINVVGTNRLLEIANKMLKLREPYGTSYFFTKAIAEQMVLEYSKKLPICIVRCIYVGASMEEPFPLTAKNRTFKVYNCVSSGLNLITLRRFLNFLSKWHSCYPTQFNITHSRIYGTSSYFHYYVNYTVLHLLPAYILDKFQQVKGSKPFFVALCKATNQLIKEVNQILFRKSEFETDNMKMLIAKAKEMEDGEHFNIDMRTLDWKCYTEKIVMGVRQYLLNINKSKL